MRSVRTDRRARALACVAVVTLTAAAGCAHEQAGESGGTTSPTTSAPVSATPAPGAGATTDPGTVAPPAPSGGPDAGATSAPASPPAATVIPDRPGVATYAPFGVEADGVPRIPGDAPDDQRCAILKGSRCNDEDLQGLHKLCGNIPEACDTSLGRDPRGEGAGG